MRRLVGHKSGNYFYRAYKNKTRKIFLLARKANPTFRLIEYKTLPFFFPLFFFLPFVLPFFFRWGGARRSFSSAGILAEPVILCDKYKTSLSFSSFSELQSFYPKSRLNSMGVMESSWALRLVVASSLPILYWIRHSLPFSWHLRVLLPYYVRRWRYTSTKPGPGISLGNPMLQLDALPIGKDPFVESYSMSFQATVDDCDFMGHLSNSCYPKSLDISRSHFAADILLQFASDGGYVPLASTSFKFVKEISFLAKYTIRSDVYAWGEKWFCKCKPASRA